MFQNRNLQIDDACSLTKHVIGRGEIRVDPKIDPNSYWIWLKGCIWRNFGGRLAIGRSRSKVDLCWWQLTELEPRLAGCVVLECGISIVPYCPTPSVTDRYSVSSTSRGMIPGCRTTHDTRRVARAWWPCSGRS